MTERFPFLAAVGRRWKAFRRGGRGANRAPARPAPRDTFCVIPWMHRFTNEQGIAQVCCVGEGQGNTLRDGTGRPIHILDGRPDEEILNLPQMKTLRRDMLAGRWNPVCERCRQEEGSGGGFGSRRGTNRRFQHLIPELRAGTAPDGTLQSPRVRSVDLRLGNLCNLTCRMCGPWAARGWVDPYNRVQPLGHRLSPEALARFDRDWVKQGSPLEQVRRQLPWIEAIHMAGGEPLIIPEMIRILEACIASGHAERIDLSYNTNLTVLPGRVTELWPRFRSVTLICSIDGFGRLNEYIRRPSRWDDVDRNLRRVDENFVAWNIREAVVSATVQVYNVLELSDLYAYLRSGFAHVLPAPKLIPLFWPEYLSIQTLPPEAKALARERLLAEQSRPEYVGDAAVAGVLASIDVVLRHLDARDLGGRREDLLAFTRNCDREFGDSLEAAAPELARLLGSGRD